VTTSLQNQPSPITQLPQIVDSRNINVIVSGTNYSMLINQETSVLKINIFARNTISNSQFSVEKLAVKPDEIPLPQNSVYSYVEIITDINDMDIDNATITFEIPKSWLSNADIKTVVMQRYHDNQWQSLETEQSDETNDFYIFDATSSGFSVFAVTARKEIEFGITGSCGDGTCNGNETKTNCCEDCGCEGNQTCMVNKCVGGQEKFISFIIWISILIVLVVFIRIGVAFWPKISERFSRHKTNRKFHPKK
jgi:PGF-pre-PGF domain-containing protein